MSILKWEVGLDCVASGAECEGDKCREILAPKFDIGLRRGSDLQWVTKRGSSFTIFRVGISEVWFWIKGWRIGHVFVWQNITFFFFFIIGKCNLSVFAVRLGDEMGLELQFIKCREDLLLVGT